MGKGRNGRGENDVQRNSLLIKESVESLEDCEGVDVLAKGGGGGIDLLAKGGGEGIML